MKHDYNTPLNQLLQYLIIQLFNFIFSHSETQYRMMLSLIQHTDFWDISRHTLRLK